MPTVLLHFIVILIDGYNSAWYLNGQSRLESQGFLWAKSCQPFDTLLDMRCVTWPSAAVILLSSKGRVAPTWLLHLFRRLTRCCERFDPNSIKHKARQMQGEGLGKGLSEASGREQSSERLQDRLQHQLLAMPYQDVRVALLTAGPSSGSLSGAERHFQGLHDGLVSIGCEVEWINEPADEPDVAATLGNYERCQAIDLDPFDVVISTKAPTYIVKRPAHVVHLMHTIRAFADMFDTVFVEPNLALYQQRTKIHALEFHALANANARFANGKERSDS